MAQYPQNSPEIQRLIRLSEVSRARLSHQTAVLRQRLDVPARLSHSIRSHPAKWLGSALGAGLAATLFFRRKPAARPQQRRGWRGALFSLALTAGRPLFKAWLTGQLKQFLVSQTRPNSLWRALASHPGPAKLP